MNNTSEQQQKKTAPTTRLKDAHIIKRTLSLQLLIRTQKNCSSRACWDGMPGHPHSSGFAQRHGDISDCTQGIDRLKSSLQSLH